MRTKFKIIALSILFCIYSCTKLKKDNYCTENNMKGHVKSITENNFKAISRFGTIEKGDKVCNDSESIDDTYICFQFLFDLNGNIIELNRFKSDGTLDSKSTYKYDEKGNNIEENYFETDGSLNTKWINQYDNKDNIVSKYEYNLVGTIHSKERYKYDEKGNLIETYTRYPDSPKEFDRENYKYDEKGNIIEIYGIGYSSLIGEGESKRNYKYDEKGNIIEENYYGNVTSYKYNSKNDLTEINEYNSYGKLSNNLIFKYEYDKIGNWIKKITFLNKIPKYVTERHIEYY